MLRKLNKQMKSNLFQLIAMKLVRSDIEAYHRSIKVLADALYDRKYHKNMDLINSLPEGFMNSASYAKLSGISIMIFKENSIGCVYLPEKESLRRTSWYDDTRNIYFTSKKRVVRSDRHQVEIVKADLPKFMLKKVEKVNKEGVALRKSIEVILNQLSSVLVSCKTVKELRKMLPEFAAFYPPDNQDNFPAVVVSAPVLQKAAKQWAKTNVQAASQ